MNLLLDTKMTKVMDSQAAGQTAVEGSILDMYGFGKVTFIVSLGTMSASAITTVHLQTGSLENGSDMADVTDSAIGADTDNDDRLLVIEAVGMNAKYIRCVILRSGGNSEIDSIIAIQSNATNGQVVQDYTEVASGKLLGSLSTGDKGFGYGYGYNFSGSVPNYPNVVTQP